MSSVRTTNVSMPLNEPRQTCPRCHRPASVCWCVGLVPVETSTRIVFLQHPRESRVAIGTARMAHLGLRQSELHEGIEFGGHPRIEELLVQPGTALLFPGPGAVSPETLPVPPRTLLVIDGTWPQARKMMALNPSLAALPRIGFMSRRPGNYRIRREPNRHCVATIEAVVEVLSVFERDPDRFVPLLRAFDGMVDRQIAAKAARTEPVRRRLRTAAPWWESRAMPDLERMWPDLVMVAAEANAHRRGSGVPGVPELVQLAAVRPSTGEVFHAFLAPRRPLAPCAATHLEVSAGEILGGRAVPDVLDAWNRFLRPSDRLVVWGGFVEELLAQEGWSPRQDPIDLRVIAAHRLKRRPGSVDAAARALAGDPQEPWPAPGRAGRAVKALAVLVDQLVRERRSANPCIVELHG
ncbi:MAG: tRNA-uridine aminocarboxypropyltransferase [Verrucomicrobiota bacterium]